MSWISDLKSYGPFWADIHHGKTGSMTAGIECSHPPTHNHFIAFVPGSDMEKGLEVATAIAKALNTVTGHRV